MLLLTPDMKQGLRQRSNMMAAAPELSHVMPLMVLCLPRHQQVSLVDTDMVCMPPGWVPTTVKID